MSRARDRRILRRGISGPRFDRALAREIRRVRNGRHAWLTDNPVTSVHWWMSVDVERSRIVQRAMNRKWKRWRGQHDRLSVERYGDIPF